MQIPTVSTYGIWRSQTFYPNGTSSTPSTQIKTASSHSGGASAIKRGDHKNPNNWSFSVTTHKSLNGTSRYVNPGNVTVVTGTLASNSGILSPSAELQCAYDDAYSKALTQFYSQLDGKADIASSIGEGGLKSGVARSLQAADDARRQAGRWGVNSIGKAWLSMQYMWLPAVSDIYALAQAATGALTRNGFTVTARGTSVQGIDAQLFTLDGYAYGRVPIQGQVSARCLIKARFKVNPWADLLAQLTSFDPLVIGWNMLPYSFVVDWFYNIGGYLGQLESAARYNSAFVPLGGFITRSHQVDASISHYGQAQGYPVYSHLNSTLTQISSSRTVISGIPLPNAPSFKVDLGSGTLLNAAALLASKLKVDFAKR